MKPAKTWNTILAKRLHKRRRDKPSETPVAQTKQRPRFTLFLASFR